MKPSKISDERKTKAQLIEELVELRLRLTRLENSEIEHKRDKEKLEAAAFVDELTGLYNRRGFLNLGKRQVKLGNRTHKHIFVLFADLDSLKKINDNFGHITGDLALVDIAGILKRTCRESDLICRWGGDEFVVVALTDDGGSFAALTARIQEAIKLHNSNQERPYKLSLSIGVAGCIPEQSCDINDLLHRADEAMYRLTKTKLSDRP